MEFLFPGSLVFLITLSGGIIIVSCFASMYFSILKLKNTGRDLQRIQTLLSPYTAFESYLARGDREKAIAKLKEMTNSFDRAIRSHFLRKKEKLIADEMRAISLKTTSFLENFSQSYVNTQVRNNHEFFDRVGMDASQLEAAVKIDRYNLVLAPAGSGKTRCLTSRIAFAVKSGAPPSSVLAVTYTNNAKDEMQRRLKDKFNIDVEVRTLHSFSRALAMYSPRYRPDVANDKHQPEFIWDALMAVLSDPKYFSHLSSFLSSVRTNNSNTRFSSAKVRNKEYVTIHNLSVKSEAEQSISNFLLLNGITFRYEQAADWADQDSHRRRYHPDFYLPNYGIYIEHWAVDRNGNVPDWFSHGRAEDPSQMYQFGMEWKRAQFRKHGKVLIETYEFEHQEGSLLPALAAKLREAGVEMHQISASSLQKYINRASPVFDPFDDYMLRFISNAKLSGMTTEDIEKKLKSDAWTSAQRSFASLMIPVWKKYEERLKRESMIDFADMMSCALDSLSAGKIEKNQYSHILIDEFQDTNDLQLLIVKKLLEVNPQAKLFCVGDDMQNIYSFAGSNVRNITHFNEFFPSPETTVLKVNYRCPKNIVDASVAVMKNNLSAVQKDVMSTSVEEHPVALFEYDEEENKDMDYDRWERTQLEKLLDHILKIKKHGEEIMVLSRYNFRLKDFSDDPENKITFNTIHTAKGMEADYVVLLGCVNGENGFPSEKEDMKILDIVRNKKYGSEEERKKELLEEERRLFYVAVTRCKKQLYVFSDHSNRSRLLEEINDYLIPQPIPSPQPESSITNR